MTIFSVRNINEQTNKFIKRLQGDGENIQLALNNSSFNIEFAHFDLEQRYTFIYSSKLGFSVNDLLGKRDDEIELNSGRVKLRELKKSVIKHGVPYYDNIIFQDKTESKTYAIGVNPVYNALEKVVGGTSVSVDISEIVNNLINSKSLNGIISFCSYCKSIRNDNGEWEQPDLYIHHNSEAQISHGICPDCMKQNIFKKLSKHSYE